MFGIVLGAMQAMLEIQDEIHFMESQKGLPIETQMSRSNARDKRKAEQAIERTIERRHREKCDAIVEAGRLAGRNNGF